MLPYRRKFLWLPKIINGKVCWLKYVRMFIEANSMIIEGKIVTYEKKRYEEE